MAAGDTDFTKSFYQIIAITQAICGFKRIVCESSPLRHFLVESITSKVLLILTSMEPFKTVCRSWLRPFVLGKSNLNPSIASATSGQLAPGKWY